MPWRWTTQLFVNTMSNVYIADTHNNAIRIWSAASNTVSTLNLPGLNGPEGVAVDKAGNVYIADAGNNAIKKWTAANNSSELPWLLLAERSWRCGGGDGAGNVYIADTFNNVGERSGGLKQQSDNRDFIGILSFPHGVAMKYLGNVYVADTFNRAAKELPRAYVDATVKIETFAAGNDTLPPVLPATENLLPPYAPASDQPWLAITGITNGVVSFAYSATTTNRTAHITLLGQSIAVSQLPNYALGATALLEGPAAGSDSVVLSVLPASGSWSGLTANASWLHVGATQSGTGSAKIVFSFDANMGAPRASTITISGQTLTVTQAGSTYLAATGALTTLVTPSSLSFPSAVAVDGSGNVYIADTLNSAIKEWTPANNAIVTLFSSGLLYPQGVAVDGSGNVYVADTGNNAIKEWTAVSHTVTALITNGLSSPRGIAVDSFGNLFLADTGNNALKEWAAANSNVTTLVSAGLNGPQSVAVDGPGNVYLADTGNNAIKKWTAVNSNVTTMISSGLISPQGVAVDGSGNVYIADAGNNAIKKWSALNSNVTVIISSGLNGPQGVAVDGFNNVYVADTSNRAVKELPHVYIDPIAKFERLAAGNDSLPGVLPATLNLFAPFAPASDQPWLTISSSNNGVVNFAFTSTATNRTAHITLLGQSISITQTPLPMLFNPKKLGPGNFQFSFSNANYVSAYTVLSTTNLSLPLANWTIVGTSSNVSPGLIQFTDAQATNAQRFYRVTLKP